MHVRAFVGTMALLAGLTATACASTFRAYSVDALKLMTEKELVHEAVRVCAQIATNRDFYSKYRALGATRQLNNLEKEDRAAFDYITRIGFVARAQLGGAYPEWFNRIQRSLTAQDCLQIWFEIRDQEGR